MLSFKPKVIEIGISLDLAPKLFILGNPTILGNKNKDQSVC